MNDLKLWGLRLKSSKGVSFTTSELVLSTIQKAGKT